MKKTLNDSHQNQRERYITLFNSLFSFKGRIRRTKYWIINLCLGLLVFPIYLTDENNVSISALLGMFFLATLAVWIGFAASAKRYHDLGKSGWWVIFQLIPIVGYAFIIYAAFFKGQEHDNKYGSNPY